MLKDTVKSIPLMSLSGDNLIRMLHITGVVALMLAGLLFVFVIVELFGIQNDKRIEEILSSPSVIEQFKKTITKSAENEALLLLEQAKTFARHLDDRKKTQETVAEQETQSISPQKPIFPLHFKVLGTSYWEVNPEMSLALIDEPGKGRYWARQSNIVGRFLIEQVKDGFVIASKDGVVFMLMIEQRAETNPIKGVYLASTGTLDYENPQHSRFKR